MRGTIDQIWENESRNGQKYLTVQMDGGRPRMSLAALTLFSASGRL